MICSLGGKNLKFLIIGLGSMGKGRIRNLQYLEAGEIMGFDIRADRRCEAKEKYGIRTFETFDAALCEEPDAIFVCVPPAFHFPYLKKAIERNKHVFVEKPISHSLGGLDEIIESSKSYGKVAMASCNMRFHSCVKKMKELVDEGTIGNVLTGMVDVGEYLPDWHPWEDYRTYYPSRKNLGGGLDAVCDLDWLTWILGDVKIVACLAGKLSSLEIDTNDVMEFILEFKSGAILGLHSDMIQRRYNRSCKLIGEQGTIMWDGVDDTVKLFRVKNKKWEIFARGDPKKKIEDMYLQETKYFINCIKGREKIMNTLENEKRLLEIVLAAIDSSQQLVYKKV